MSAVFVSVTVQFHLHQRRQFDNPLLIELDRLLHVGGCGGVLVLHFAAGQQNVQALAGFTGRSIQKDDRIHHLVAHKTGLLQGDRRTRQIGLLQEQVHVSRISHRAIIDRGYPRGDRVSANHCIGNLRGAQCLTGSIQSLLNEFHCPKHPLEDIERRLLDLARWLIGVHPEIVPQTKSKTGSGPVF